MPVKMYDLAAGDDSIRFSPYCWRIRMALAHKGLDVETIPVRFMEKHKIEFSGQKLVPVICDNDNVVSDSWAIAEYLDEAYPDRPLLFPNAQAKALTNFVRHWTQTRLGLPLMRVALLDIYNAIHEEDRPYFRTSREQRFGKKLEDVVAPQPEALAAFRAELAPARETLAAQAFLNGETPAFADYCLFGVMMFARGVSTAPLLEESDPVHAWRERMLDLHGGLARKAPGRGA